MTPDQLAKSKSEHGEQRAVFAWCNMAFRYGPDCANDDLSYTVKGYAQDFNKPISRLGLVCLVPELEWIYAIHNQGHGDAIRGGRAKAEGVKAGVSDICLPVKAQASKYMIPTTQNYPYYCGLYIEMKKVKGGVESEQQEKFGAFVTAQGYKYVVCNGWREAVKAICEYLGLK